MLRKLWRVVPAALAVQGAGMIWLARYGALWQYNDLGWFQPLVLRPGMYVTGAAALVYGAWHAWLAYTTPGRVLRAWADDVAHDLHCGAVADLGWRAAWRNFLKELWSRRACALGRHDPEALEFRAAIDYGTPTGTYCEDCGLCVSAFNTTPAAPTVVAFRAPPRFPDALSQEESDRLVYGEDGPVPDPLRHLEPTPANLLRAQAGRCAEAGLHDTAAELREEADHLEAEGLKCAPPRLRQGGLSRG